MIVTELFPKVGQKEKLKQKHFYLNFKEIVVSSKKL